MRKTLNEHAMILNPITNGDTLKRLNLIKNNILTKWDEYTKVDQGKNDDDFAANQLKWIFNPLCISAETTNSLYQVYWNGSNIIEIRIANHNANNNNYSNIQLANQPVAQILAMIYFLAQMIE